MNKPTTQHNSNEEAGVVRLQGYTQEAEIFHQPKAGARNVKLTKKLM